MAGNDVAGAGCRCAQLVVAHEHVTDMKRCRERTFAVDVLVEMADVGGEHDRPAPTFVSPLRASAAKRAGRSPLLGEPFLRWTQVFVSLGMHRVRSLSNSGSKPLGVARMTTITTMP